MEGPTQVLSFAADSTNAFAFPILVSKVTLEHADGSAALKGTLINGVTNSVTADISLTTNLADGTTFQRYTEANFDPPHRIGDAKNNVMVDITGTGTMRVFFQRG